MIQTQLIDCPPSSALEPRWLALTRAADVSFFQSWTWIGSWLESLPSERRPQLLQAQRDGVDVGLALLGRRTTKRHGFIRSRGLHLHASGDPTLDAIAVEYNGFVVGRDTASEAEQAMLAHLLSEPHWDELFLPGLVTPSANLRGAPGTRWQTEHKPFFFVDLAQVRGNEGGFLAVLSQQRRYQVRKTEKAFSKFGPVELRVAQTVEEALEMLQALKALHQPYWEARGFAGAFGSEFANRFHDNLVRRGFPDQAVQLMHLTAGDRTIGYLYNFVHRGRVCNYQSGVDYGLLGSAVSPGLICHAKAIAHSATCGHDIYDFMAGDFRYKRSLSTDIGELQWAVLQRDRLTFRIEDALRQVKRRLAARKAAASASPDTVSGDTRAATA